MESKKENKKCDVCGEYKDDVMYVADPFLEEVYDQIEYKNMCVECYNESIYDI